MNDGKERRHLLVGEHGRRLVKDDHTVIVEQSAGDLHKLLVGKRNSADFRLRGDIATKICKLCCGGFVHSGVVEQAAAQKLSPQKHIFGDRQTIGEHDFLVHQSDARVLGFGRPLE